MWPDIETITLANVQVNDAEIRDGIDHALLGIDKEMVKGLRTANATHFKPTGPSILDKKSTKT